MKLDRRQFFAAVAGIPVVRFGVRRHRFNATGRTSHSLARRRVDYLLLGDELDRWADGAGPVQMAMERTVKWNRTVIINSSTP